MKEHLQKYTLTSLAVKCVVSEHYLLCLTQGLTTEAKITLSTQPMSLCCLSAEKTGVCPQSIYNLLLNGLLIYEKNDKGNIENYMIK